MSLCLAQSDIFYIPPQSAHRPLSLKRPFCGTNLSVHRTLSLKRPFRGTNQSAHHTLSLKRPFCRTKLSVHRTLSLKRPFCGTNLSAHRPLSLKRPFCGTKLWPKYYNYYKTENFCFENRPSRHFYCRVVKNFAKNVKILI